jgi:hypothetical protein
MPDRFSLLYLTRKDSTNRLTEEQISLLQGDPLLGEPTHSSLALSDVRKRRIVTDGARSTTMGRALALIHDAARDSLGSTHTAWLGVCKSDNRSGSPLGIGEGHRTLGWLVKSGTDPPPRLP